MPLTHFICPDGKRVAKEDCLEECYLLRGRCFPLPMLQVMSKTRSYGNRKHSVTELISPSRYQYLMSIKDYAERPKDMLFKITGSAVHYFLSEKTDNYLQEVRLENDIFSGQIDAYDCEEKTLYDYKFIGKYKVGLVKTPEGLQEHGRDYILQENAYRLLLEGNGHKVDKMILVALTRDFRNYEYKREKLKGKEIEPIYFIDIPRLDDKDVIGYFASKKTALDLAFSQNRVPDRCSDDEIWDGKRCKDYCVVNEHCSYYKEGIE